MDNIYTIRSNKQCPNTLYPLHAHFKYHPIDAHFIDCRWRKLREILNAGRLLAGIRSCQKRPNGRAAVTQVSPQQARQQRVRGAHYLPTPARKSLCVPPPRKRPRKSQKEIQIERRFNGSLLWKYISADNRSLLCACEREGSPSFFALPRADLCM